MRLPVCCLLLLLAVGARGMGFGTDPDFEKGQDEGFDLGDALEPAPTAKPQPGEGGRATDGPVDITKKPTAKPQPGGGGGGEFNLEDILNEDDPFKKPTTKPQPGRDGGHGGSFDDSDLGVVDPNHPSAHDDKPSGGEEPAKEGDKQSMVAGIVGAVAAALVGAASSFIAYQKKKLCFKGATDDPENVNMDSHKGDPSEPQAQNSLLAK